MKELTRYEARAAESYLSAIPFKTAGASLPGRTIAAVAIAVATVHAINETTDRAFASIAEKVKPDGYDQNCARRDEAIRAAFPDGTDFDSEKWQEVCPDPEFEKQFNETEAEFRKAVNEAGAEKVNVDVRLTPDHLADISELLVSLDTVTVNGIPVPTPSFLFTIASLIG